MSDLEEYPALAKYVGSVESNLADEELLKAELEAAKKDLSRMPEEQCKEVLNKLAHIPGLGSEAANALEGNDTVQGGRARKRSKSRRKSKGKSNGKKKSKSPRKKK